MGGSINLASSLPTTCVHARSSYHSHVSVAHNMLLYSNPAHMWFLTYLYCIPKKAGLIEHWYHSVYKQEFLLHPGRSRLTRLTCLLCGTKAILIIINHSVEVIGITFEQTTLTHHLNTLVRLWSTFMDTHTKLDWKASAKLILYKVEKREQKVQKTQQ